MEHLKTIGCCIFNIKLNHDKKKLLFNELLAISNTPIKHTSSYFFLPLYTVYICISNHQVNHQVTVCEAYAEYQCCNLKQNN